MSNALNVRLVNDVKNIAQGDNASTVVVELLDNDGLILPYLNGEKALINFINNHNEIQYQFSTYIFDSRVEFNIATVIPSGTYYVEIQTNVKEFAYVFPSSVNYKLRINKSSNHYYNTAISIDGVEVVANAVYQKLMEESQGFIQHIENKDIHVTKDQKDKWDEHVDDKDIHVTLDDKNEWNEHVEDKDIHVELDEKESWNEHIDDNSIHVTEQDKENWDEHTENEDIHVTANDKNNWDEHVENNDIHVTIENKEDWNSKLDSSDLEVINAHLENKDNPHEVSKEQLGLENVENYGIANGSQATEGESSTHYMTPQRTRQAIEALAPTVGEEGEIVGYTTTEVFNEHVEDEDIHVTAEEKDAWNNKADSSELENLNDHLEDEDNPHKVTKAQVGLAQVPNYGIAPVIEAEQGMEDTGLMTPYRTKKAIEAQVDQSGGGGNVEEVKDWVKSYGLGTEQLENVPVDDLNDLKVNGTFVAPEDTLNKPSEVETLPGIVTNKRTEYSLDGNTFEIISQTFEFGIGYSGFTFVRSSNSYSGGWGDWKTSSTREDVENMLSSITHKYPLEPRSFIRTPNAEVFEGVTAMTSYVEAITNSTALLTLSIAIKKQSGDLKEVIPKNTELLRINQALQLTGKDHGSTFKSRNEIIFSSSTALSINYDIVVKASVRHGGRDEEGDPKEGYVSVLAGRDITRQSQDTTYAGLILLN